MLYLYQRFTYLLERAFSNASILFIGLTIVFGFVRVLFRHLPIGSPAFYSEFALLSFLWAVLLESAAQVKNNGHIVVDTFLQRFPSFVRLLLEYIYHVVIIIIGLLFVFYGIRFIISQRYNTLTYFGYPRWWTYYSPLPICGVGIALFEMERLLLRILER